MTSVVEKKTEESPVDESSSDGSAAASPLVSRESSSSDLTSLPNATTQTKLSLEDRSKIPTSLYLSLGIIAISHVAGDIWSMKTAQKYMEAMSSARGSFQETLGYLRDIMQAAFQGQITNWKEFASVCIITTLVGCLLYVLIVAPLMAGVWTGPRSRKHKVHRYMGLLYLVQYGAAWTHYLTNYEEAKDTYLTHFIALNGKIFPILSAWSRSSSPLTAEIGWLHIGIIQGYSAFFSFKVLPEAVDPGYYSDKAVASRNFIHENVYYTMMAAFGSIYYNDEWRGKLQSDFFGQFVELLFVFFPYVIFRPFFPVTRFSAAGTGRNGRSKQNELFYTVGTKMVKIFYLWAKYFLGFYVNFMVYLNLLTPTQWKVLHGMYLLNLGTVSIAIFLHTLRFKKILPAKLTFSIYLLQIYA
jgi:hypothetical protein